jgi:hypothetical protein
VRNTWYEELGKLSSCVLVTRIASVSLVMLFAAASAAAQAADPPADSPKERTQGGYVIHQSVDLGGRIADYSGSGSIYDTLVNLQSGPRILSQSLDMRATGKTKYPFFDTLIMANSGYGGDPNSFTMLRVAKKKLYDFQGLFRRDREYFDYNLFDNPLVPAGVISNGYTFPQVLHSPHLFNTVRRMTDINLTVLPLSTVSFRAGYSQNVNQGPSYSSQHNGAEALYLQNWRNSTDTWLGAVDWKPFSKTTLTFEESVSHYKGNTNWQLTGLNLQLSNGTPVTLGFDNVTAPTCADGNPAIVSNSTTPPTANATCNGYLQYSRNAPTRTLFPTEEFRFQSSKINNLQMNGRVRYTGASMNLPRYYEQFNGLDNMGIRVFTTTGNGRAKRVNVSADYGIVWRISEKIHLSEQFDFWNFRQPADTFLSQVDQTGTSLLVAPDPASPPAITTAHNYLGMKTKTNTLTLGYNASSKVSFSIGYRYRARTIGFVMPLVTDALPNGTAYNFDTRDNGGLFGVSLHPSRQWKINGSVEVSYANRTYTQISPRALQHYQFRTSYKPVEWVTLSGSFNDLERRNNVLNVNHLDHSRSATMGASLTPNKFFGVALSYGYSDVFSRTTFCYAATPAPPGALPAPPDDGIIVNCGTNTNLGNGYYNAPTQYGSIDLTLTPIKKLRADLGYRVSAVDGTAEFLNLLQVSGSLQSRYQTPYAKVAWTLRPGWVWKGDWNYYGYGEGSPVGPTSARSFHGNVYTVAVHHEF